MPAKKRAKLRRMTNVANAWRNSDQMHDGEWVWPRRKKFVLGCCDCGLLHKIWFRLVPHGNGKRIEFKAVRDDRATSALRRKMQRQ